MEAAFQPVVAAESQRPMARMSQYSSRLPRQRSDRDSGCDHTAASSLMRQTAHRPAGDGGHGFEQVASLWISVKSACHLADPLRQSRCRFRNGTRDLWQQLPGKRRSGFGYDRKQFARCHSD